MELNGKFLDITKKLDGMNTRTFEVELNKNKYKFKIQTLMYDSLVDLHNQPIKLNGILNDNNKTITNVSDIWIKIF